MEQLLDINKISENGRNIYEWNPIQSINQYSKLISIEFPGMNRVVWYFEDLEYLNTINIQYSEILFNVTERGYSKLDPLESMVVSFGRSTFCHFQSLHSYFALSTNMNYHPIIHKGNYHWVELTVMMEDLFKSFHSHSFNTFDYCWERPTKGIIS